MILSHSEMIRSFNFFRILGTLVIFITHLKLKNGIDGSVGLDLFFVLSGFVIFTGYSDKLIGPDKLSFKLFLQKRIMKIYPVYSFMIIAGLIYMVEICDFPMTSTLIKLPGHLLFLQPFIKGYYSAFNGAGWYVAALMWLYAIFYYIGYGKKAYWGIVIWTLMMVVLSVTGAKWLDETRFDFKHSPTTVIIFFYIGIVAAHAFKFYKLSLPETCFSLLEFILSVSIISIAFFMPVESFTHNLCACLLIAVTYYVFAHSKGFLSKCFSSSILQMCASYTFYFYMSHYMIIQYTVHIFSLSETSLWVSITLFFMSVAGAYFLKLFDDNIQKFLKTRFQN